MKSYIKEIPGRVHKKNEDSHYHSIFRDKQGNEFGLFMVADGCSGYSGTTASHLATMSIGYSVEDEILCGVRDYETVLFKAIDFANKELHNESSARTTLDLLLVAEGNFYVAHLGDSRIYSINEGQVTQLTKDEAKRGEPTNYLGALFDDKNRSLKDRLEIKRFDYLPEAFLLTTDGLTSRVVDGEIVQLLGMKREFYDYAEILNELAELVRIPRGRIGELSENVLRKEFAGIVGLNFEKGVTKDILIDNLLKTYGEKSNAALIQAVDKLIKFDDTTIIYVDIANRVSRSLEESKNLAGVSQQISLQRNQYQHDLDVRNGELEQAKRELTDLQSRFGEVDGKLSGLQTEYGVLQQTNSVLDQDLRKAQEDLRGHEGHVDGWLQKLRNFMKDD